MKNNLLTYILTLLIVLLSAILSYGKTIQITKVYELQKDFNIEKRDTLLFIELNVPFIRIGTKTYVGSKRNTYYSSEDYIIYDEFKNNQTQTKIIFEYNPDNGDILQVSFEGIKTLYYRP